MKTASEDAVELFKQHFGKPECDEDFSRLGAFKLGFDAARKSALEKAFNASRITFNNVTVLNAEVISLAHIERILGVK